MLERNADLCAASQGPARIERKALALHGEMGVEDVEQANLERAAGSAGEDRARSSRVGLQSQLRDETTLKG